ncbi:MAG TPA: acyl-CoA desaturase [Chitinophagales bacterium]|nr:acyl-CoA desaturase [Chitinophagales bacterium]HMZ88960.1 acyl-CoA desaturase [Chitinophagales bacterium]HNA57899.1 acyl-CoA desaturase [Chitinophagales bacterium]HNE44809.1 acyl-CoA desaturase [Chitinophagales bacterium]HNF69650.1 acyl-CoA desaturase [Chitinophagales bacterium]
MNKKGSVKFVNPDQHLFYQTLKENVNRYFKENGISTHANAQMVTKTIVLFIMYLAPYVLLMTTPMSYGLALGLWSLMGVAFAGIGMSVMHDANHGAYSDSPGVNKMMGYSLNMVGSMVFNWKLQHNILHHTYTNITGLDEDIQAKAGMRFTPNVPLNKPHRWQFIYVFGLYGIMTLYWIIFKDFFQLVRYRKQGVNAASSREYRMQFIKLLAIKAIYFFAIIAAPIIWAGFSFWQVALGFVVMHVVGSFILSLVFQLAHTVEGTDHPTPDKDGIVHNIWAVHQLQTTMNFARKNKVLSWYVGGLNFQVEHHLFPKICHVHYPKIAPIVKQTAEQFNIPYLENETFWIALRSHLRLLYDLGRIPKLDDIMD